MTDPSAVARTFASTAVDDETVLVPILRGIGVPDDAGLSRLAFYAGMFHLLAEEAVRSAADERSALDLLVRAEATVRSIEGPVRFARFEQGRSIEATELVARMQGREVAILDGWMLPRLRAQIDRYRERIAAVRRALGTDR
jgi:hypothetical protein